MTKELNSLKPGELRTLKRGVAIVKKVFNLTDEDLDAFFALVKNAKHFSEVITATDKRISDLERAIMKKADADAHDKVRALSEYINARPQEYKL